MSRLLLRARHQAVVLENSLVAKVLGGQVDDWVVCVVRVEDKALLHPLLLFLFAALLVSPVESAWSTLQWRFPRFLMTRRITRSICPFCHKHGVLILLGEGGRGRRASFGEDLAIRIFIMAGANGGIALFLIVARSFLQLLNDREVLLGPDELLHNLLPLVPELTPPVLIAHM